MLGSPASLVKNRDIYLIREKNIVPFVSKMKTTSYLSLRKEKQIVPFLKNVKFIYFA